MGFSAAYPFFVLHREILILFDVGINDIWCFAYIFNFIGWDFRINTALCYAHTQTHTHTSNYKSNGKLCKCKPLISILCIGLIEHIQQSVLLYKYGRECGGDDDDGGGVDGGGGSKQNVVHTIFITLWPSCDSYSLVSLHGSLFCVILLLFQAVRFLVYMCTCLRVCTCANACPCASMKMNLKIVPIISILSISNGLFPRAHTPIHITAHTQSQPIHAHLQLLCISWKCIFETIGFPFIRFYILCT